jgi:myo-inositol-1(or 4)-monophosphatase
VIARGAEAVVVSELDRLREQGYRFLAISEERGEIDYGDADVRVIVDPIDGSLNAKRGIPHHALSIAVADGDTMADVTFAFVYDFGPSEEWWARRGEGAWLNERRLDPTLRERRDRDGRLEVLGIESADPRWVADSIAALVDSAYRLRALGSIASSLCQVAAARFDGMLSLRRARGVDAAAGQLIVREAGGLVSFPSCADPLAAPLDAVPSSPVIAARSQETLHHLEGIPAR